MKKGYRLSDLCPSLSVAYLSLQPALPMANLEILFTKLISAFLLLPLNLLVLSTLGLVLLTRHPRLGRLTLITTSLLWYVVSTPILVDTLRKQAETIPSLDPTAPLPQADAIVVLSGVSTIRRRNTEETQSTAMFSNECGTQPGCIVSLASPCS
jgi:hypothetical protein